MKLESRVRLSKDSWTDWISYDDMPYKSDNTILLENIESGYSISFHPYTREIRVMIVDEV